MPLPFLPSIASGGGAIPITGGSATSGPATSGTGTFGPVNIAGIGSMAGGINPLVLAIGAAAIVAGIFFFRRK